MFCSTFSRVLWDEDGQINLPEIIPMALHSSLTPRYSPLRFPSQGNEVFHRNLKKDEVPTWAGQGSARISPMCPCLPVLLWAWTSLWQFPKWAAGAGPRSTRSLPLFPFCCIPTITLCKCVREKMEAAVQSTTGCYAFCPPTVRCYCSHPHK